MVGGSAPDANGDVSVTMTQPSPGPVSVYAEATYSDGTVSDSLPVTFYVQQTSWQPTANNGGGGSLQGGQIISPQDQTQSPAYPVLVTVVPGGSLNCAVSSGQDTDFWKLTPDIEGVQNLLSPVDDSGDLSYSWSGPGTFSSPTSDSTNWTAPSGATLGQTATLTCTITDNGDPIGPFDIGTKTDPGTLTSSVTVKYVASGGSSSINPTLTVQNCNQWNPNPAYVGDAIHGTVTSTLTPDNLDSDGSGATFVTYSWGTSIDDVFYSATGAAGTFAAGGGSYSIGWNPLGSSTTFNAVSTVPGSYVTEVTCTATVCDSSTGGALASATAQGYIGDPSLLQPPPTGQVTPQQTGTAQAWSSLKIFDAGGNDVTGQTITVYTGDKTTLNARVGGTLPGAGLWSFSNAEIPIKSYSWVSAPWTMNYKVDTFPLTGSDISSPSISVLYTSVVSRTRVTFTASIAGHSVSKDVYFVVTYHTGPVAPDNQVSVNAWANISGTKTYLSRGQINIPPTQINFPFTPGPDVETNANDALGRGYDYSYFHAYCATGSIGDWGKASASFLYPDLTFVYATNSTVMTNRRLGANFNFGAMAENAGMTIQAALSAGQILSLAGSGSLHPSDEQLAIEEGYYWMKSSGAALLTGSTLDIHLEYEDEN